MRRQGAPKNSNVIKSNVPSHIDYVQKIYIYRYSLNIIFIKDITFIITTNTYSKNNKKAKTKKKQKNEAKSIKMIHGRPTVNKKTQ